MSALVLAAVSAGAQVLDVEAYYQQRAQERTALMLTVGEIDPTLASFTFPASYAADTQRSASGKRYFMAQFDHTLSSAELDSLAGNGWELMDLVPYNGYIFRTKNQALSTLRSTPGVRWADDLKAGYKTENTLISAAESADRASTLDVVVNVWPGESRKEVAEALAAMGATILQTPSAELGVERVWVRIAPGLVPAAAGMDAVQWVEPLPVVTLRNNACTGVLQSGNANVKSIWDKGLHGEGQIIGHADGGIAMSSCYVSDTPNTPGPTHRKVVLYSGTSGSDSHGTHTAGTIAGKNVSGDLNNAGHAYEAKIAHTVLNTITGVNDTGTSNFAAKLLGQQNAGAFTHTNSWGSDGITNYTLHCVDIDTFTYNNEDSVVMFACTNASGVLYTPENAKNSLSVGNAQRSPNHLTPTTGSCVGPTADGRRKPEIFASGTSTVSASTAACGTTSSTGTSMATPALTGAATLIRQYFTEGWYPSGAKVAEDAMVPSGALLRAMVLNGGQNMTPANYPSNQEGWGLLKLDDCLYFAGEARKLFVYDARRSAGNGLATGGSYEKVIASLSSTEPFRATMVWMDPPAARNTSSPMINNLDLEVVAPDGSTYKGNVFSGGQSTTGGTADAINNAETVLINTPQVGAYTVRVKGTNVASANPQGFALVIAGDLGAGNRGVISVNGTEFSCADTMNISVLDGNAAGATQTVDVVSGGDSESVVLTQSAPGKWDGTLATTGAAATSGNGTLSVASGQAITIRYNDADNGTSGAESITKEATGDCSAPVLSNVAIGPVADVNATFTFDTDEAVTGELRVGTTCGNFTITAPIVADGDGYKATVTGLTGSQWYDAKIWAEDEHGNGVLADNGGACWRFQTLVREVQFEEDVEPNGSAMTLDPTSGTGIWRTQAYANSNTPSNSMFTPGLNATGDFRLVTPSITLPANPGELSFWHTFEFEFSNGTAWDGGVLEITTNGGTNWTDLGTNIVSGGYTGTLDSNNALGARQAWTAGTLGPMTQVRVNLQPFAGQTVRIRWRHGCDTSVVDQGWYVDTIAIDRFTVPVSASVEGWSVE